MLRPCKFTFLHLFSRRSSASLFGHVSNFFFPHAFHFWPPPFRLPPLLCRHQRSSSQAPEEPGEGDPDAAPLKQLLLVPQPKRDQPQPGGTPSAPSSVIGCPSKPINSKLFARASAARSRGRAQAVLLHAAGAFQGQRVDPQRPEERGGEPGGRSEALALPVATPAAAARLQPAGEHCGAVELWSVLERLRMERLKNIKYSPEKVILLYYQSSLINALALSYFIISF